MSRAPLLRSGIVPGEVIVADFTDGSWELSEIGGATTLQYDAGLAGSFATSRSYSVDPINGLRIRWESATANQYAGVSYIPASPLNLSKVPEITQFQVEAEWPEWCYYGTLQLYVATQGGNTFTNYFNRGFGDGTAKIPRRQVINFNISQMTATGGGANLASIGKFHFRFIQSANGATATQPGEIFVRKVWAR